MDEQDKLQNKLVEALERVRRDSYRPWRYVLFSLLNGVAQGLGIAMGMTVVLAVVAFVLTRMLASMVDFPVIGEYVSEIAKLLDAYLKQGVRVR